MRLATRVWPCCTVQVCQSLLRLRLIRVGQLLSATLQGNLKSEALVIFWVSRKFHSLFWGESVQALIPLPSAFKKPFSCD